MDPVTDNCPGYFEVIKAPMCLRVVEERLRAGTYAEGGGAEHAAFAADVRLIAANARLYNPPGHWVHAAAVVRRTTGGAAHASLPMPHAALSPWPLSRAGLRGGL